MKSKIVICAIAAASLGMGSLSFAQGRGNDRDNNRQGYQQRDNDRQGYQNRDNDRRGNGVGNRGGRDDQFAYGARGPEWRRGGHVPQQYRGHQYVVNDWRGHHLSAPPRGHQWVQVGGDYVLVAIATGIIAQLLLNQ
jgi:Ni/Co efflux regulator RcnB